MIYSPITNTGNLNTRYSIPLPTIPERLKKQIELVGKLLVLKVVDGYPIFIYATRDAKIHGIIHRNGLTIGLKVRWNAPIDLSLAPANLCDEVFLNKVKSILHSHCFAKLQDNTVTLQPRLRGGGGYYLEPLKPNPRISNALKCAGENDNRNPHDIFAEIQSSKTHLKSIISFGGSNKVSLLSLDGQSKATRVSIESLKDQEYRDELMAWTEAENRFWNKYHKTFITPKDYPGKSPDSYFLEYSKELAWGVFGKLYQKPASVLSTLLKKTYSDDELVKINRQAFDIEQKLKDYHKIILDKTKTTDEKLDCCLKSSQLVKEENKLVSQLIEKLSKLDLTDKQKEDLIKDLFDDHQEVRDSIKKGDSATKDKILSDQNLNSVKLTTHAVADLISISNPKLGNQVRTLGCGGIEIVRHIRNIQKMTTITDGIKKFNFSSALSNLGSVSGAISEGLKMFLFLVDDMKDPTTVLSEQISDLAQTVHEFRQEMHGRLDRIENGLIEIHREMIQRFDLLADQINRFYEVSKYYFESLQIKNDFLLNAIKKGFGEICWSEFKKESGKAITFVNDPRGDKYLDLLDRHCEISDSADKSITGLLNTKLDDASVISSLKDDALENNINYLALYFGFSTIEYPNPYMWAMAVMNYIRVRQKIRESNPYLENLISSNHDKNFARLFTKGNLLNEQIRNLQLDFASKKENNAIGKQLKDYRQKLEKLKKLDIDDFEKISDEKVILEGLNDFEASYLLLKNLIELSFNSSFECDLYFASFLQTPLAAPYSLADREAIINLIRTIRMLGPNDDKKPEIKIHKTFLYKEFFVNLNYTFKIFEKILEAKAEAIQANNATDNYVLVDYVQDKLYRFEEEVNLTPVTWQQRIIKWVSKEKKLQPRPFLKPPLLSYQVSLPLFKDDLFLSALIGDKENIERLLKEGKQATLDEIKRTALHYAAQNGEPEIINMFAEMIKISSPDEFNNTPVHVAAERGNIAIFAASEVMKDHLLLARLLMSPNKASITPLSILQKKRGQNKEMSLFEQQSQEILNPYFAEGIKSHQQNPLNNNIFSNGTGLGIMPLLSQNKTSIKFNGVTLTLSFSQPFTEKGYQKVKLASVTINGKSVHIMNLFGFADVHLLLNESFRIYQLGIDGDVIMVTGAYMVKAGEEIPFTSIFNTNGDRKLLRNQLCSLKGFKSYENRVALLQYETGLSEIFDLSRQVSFDDKIKSDELAFVNLNEECIFIGSQIDKKKQMTIYSLQKGEKSGPLDILEIPKKIDEVEPKASEKTLEVTRTNNIQIPTDTTRWGYINRLFKDNAITPLGKLFNSIRNRDWNACIKNNSHIIPIVILSLIFVTPAFCGSSEQKPSSKDK